MAFLQAYFPSVTREDGSFSLRLTIHSAISFVLLFLLMASQPVSNFMMSGMEILLAVNWLLEWDMRAKLERGRRQPLLWAFLVLMLVHVVWQLLSTNTGYGWEDIFRKLPLLAIPLVVLTSRPLNRIQLWTVLMGFVLSVFVATIIGRVRMATIPDLPYRDIIPFISHIRFSMNVCLALVVLAWLAVERHRCKGKLSGDWLLWVVAVVALSFVDFLLRLRSYTAFVMLFVVAVVLLAVFWKRIGHRLARVCLALLLTLVLAFAAVSALMVRDYYRLVPLAKEPLGAVTANGNPYQHKQDGLIENGNYVNNYICRSELESEWAKRSSMPLDELTDNEYTVYPTLLRYLNAMGVAKDSAGVALLHDEDVRAIEKGIANPVYVHGSSLRKMYYVMFFEYECYGKLGAVKDFTMLQRFELWKNAWRVFKKQPLMGVGTGDVVDCCHKQLETDGSPLAGTKKHTHNQYLTFLVTFGLLGFSIIVLMFVYAFRRQRLLRIPAVLAFVTIVLVSFITEDTLETLAGCVFSVLFLCLMGVGERKELRIKRAYAPAGKRKAESNSLITNH